MKGRPLEYATHLGLVGNLKMGGPLRRGGKAMRMGAPPGFRGQPKSGRAIKRGGGSPKWAGHLN